MDKQDSYKQEMLELIEQHTNQEQEAVDENVENKEETEIIEEAPKEEPKINDNEEIKPEVNYDKELAGLPKELIEIVKTFKDPEDREKAIKIAKEQRAREDRLHFQLGNTKKDLENVSGLLNKIETNPAETFKLLAKRVNFDLNQLVDQPVLDELYSTPEEKIEKTTANIQKNTLNQTIEFVNQREASELLSEFLDGKDESIIAENEQEFLKLYNQELMLKGQKNYYLRKERMQAMENAYNKLERFQPDFEEKLRLKIEKEINGQKKEKFDEAKRQLKISKPLSNTDKPKTYKEIQMEAIRKFGF